MALCNPLPVWSPFQVLVSSGWFQSSARPWRTSFQASWGSLQFVITPTLAPKNGSGQDWQNLSCCHDAKFWEPFFNLSWLCLWTMVFLQHPTAELGSLQSARSLQPLEPAAGSKEFPLALLHNLEREIEQLCGCSYSSQRVTASSTWWNKKFYWKYREYILKAWVTDTRWLCCRVLNETWEYKMLV